MNKKPYILGICAANSGSGKTYVIENLIPELKKRGYSSSAIKHAHHNFDIDKPGIVPNISPINIPGGTTAQASVSSDNKAMASWNAGPSIIC